MNRGGNLYLLLNYGYDINKRVRINSNPENKWPFVPLHFIQSEFDRYKKNWLNIDNSCFQKTNLVKNGDNLAMEEN